MNSGTNTIRAKKIYFRRSGEARLVISFCPWTRYQSRLLRKKKFHYLFETDRVRINLKDASTGLCRRPLILVAPRW